MDKQKLGSRSHRSLAFQCVESRLCLTAVSFASLDVADSVAGDVISAADLDGDLDTDILAADFDGKIVWHENVDGEGSFGQSRTVAEMGERASTVVAVDVDNDGDLDVLAGWQSGNRDIAWFENTDGNATFAAAQDISTSGRGVQSIEAHDIDGDLDADLIVLWDDQVSIFENTDSQGSFSERPLPFLGQLVNTLSAADMDSDGDVDLLLEFGRPSWYENMDGLGTFEPAERNIGRVPVSDVTAADVDGDGDNDVVASYSYYGQSEVFWFENVNGLGDFGPKTTIDPRAASGLRMLTSGDADGDGDTDVITTGGANGIAWYENLDGNGSFGAAIGVTLNNTLSLVAADFDLDGDLDLAAAGGSGNGVTWYENRPVGDSNDDGVFNTSDLITVFQFGEYEDDLLQNSTYAEGDWNGDGEFNSGDIIFAFRAGTFSLAFEGVRLQPAAQPMKITDVNERIAAALLADEFYATGEFFE